MSKKARKARKCSCGRKIPPGANYCPSCVRVTTKGVKANITKAVKAQAKAAAMLTKAASGPPAAWWAPLALDPDPDKRELYQQLKYGKKGTG